MLSSHNKIVPPEALLKMCHLKNLRSLVLGHMTWAADSRVAAACGLRRQKELIKRLASLCLVSNVREEINEINFRFV